MAYKKKDSGNTSTTNKTVEKTNKTENTEIKELRSAIDALKAQNELLMKMVLENKGAPATTVAFQGPKSLTQEVTLVHLVECASGLNTHIELSNTTIDMAAFGEERVLDLRQAEEISGKYRKFFDKGIIAFGEDGEELAHRFGLKSIADYPYLKKDFVQKLGALSLYELENLYKTVSSGHKKFIIEYVKRKIAEGDPAFKDIHKVEMLDRVSGGAMSGTTLDFKREAEEAAAKKN